jgi:hypothetical protein
LTASAGYGRAERLSEFAECLCLTVSAGYGCAERLSEFFEVLCLLLGMLFVFLASAHEGRHVRGSSAAWSTHKGDHLPEVAPTGSGHRADPKLVRAPGDEPVESLLRLSRRLHVDPGLPHLRVLPLIG